MRASQNFSGLNIASTLEKFKFLLLNESATRKRQCYTENYKGLGLNFLPTSMIALQNDLEISSFFLHSATNGYSLSFDNLLSLVIELYNGVISVGAAKTSAVTQIRKNSRNIHIILF